MPDPVEGAPPVEARRRLDLGGCASDTWGAGEGESQDRMHAPATRSLCVRAVQAGSLAAGTVFVAGFGVMNAFWRLQEQSGGLAGLYDYRSATWGDGLLLPLTAGLLGSAAVLGPSERSGRAWAAAAGCCGFALGAFTQVAWLADPSPGLNWTLPAAHRFNEAGWYHAAFLSCASGYLSWLLARAVRAASGGGVGAMPRFLLAGSAMSALGFGWLLAADNSSTADTAASRSTIGVIGAVVGGGVAALVAWSMTRQRRRR